MSLIAFLVLLALALVPLRASAWNIPGHIVSAAIAYQVLQQENPQTIEKVKAVLEKHPWYTNQWQARLQAVPVGDHGLVLFVQPADPARGPKTELRFKLSLVTNLVVGSSGG